MPAKPFTLTAVLALSLAAQACRPLASPVPTLTVVPTAAPSATPVPSATATATPAATPTASPAPTATPAATATAAPSVLKIISDLPMTGSELGLTQVIVNGEQLRLEQAKNQACGGRYRLSFESWDDASAATGRWDAAQEAANANKAAADASIVAYLGTFNSGAAKVAIPILNQAGPLVMISPGNTYPGLTKPVAGVAGEPDIYYPSGVRNYARVVSADDVQGVVAARFVHDQLQAKSVYILDDKTLYGQLIAGAFADEAERLGLAVVGRSSFDPDKGSYTTLMGQIARSNHGRPPDLIYAGMVAQFKSADLLKAKVAALGNNTRVKFMGADGIQTQSIIDDAGAAAAGIYATVLGLSRGHMPAAEQQVYADYAARFGPTNDPYAAYGYEAMNVALKAIEDVCAAGGNPADRQAVRAAVFHLKDFDGALGQWSFDANGDISLTDTTFYQVINGKYQSVAFSRDDQITAIP